MFRYVFSSRGIIFGFVFFVLIVSGSLFYSWHVRRSTEADLGRRARFLRGFENKDETRPAQSVSVPTEASNFVDMSEENENTEPVSHDTNVSSTEEASDIDFQEEFDLFEPLDEEASDLVGKEVRVSPFGFGPYPEIPEGFPFDNPWDVPTTNATFELMHRVQIKLWNEGKRPEGMTWEKGRVYPIYPNTIYVEWDYFEAEDGSMERYISEVTAGTLSLQAEALLDEGIVPPGVTVYKYSEAGIDPYSYLGLQ